MGADGAADVLRPGRTIARIRRRIVTRAASAMHGAEARLRRPDVVLLGDSITREWLAADPAFFIGQRRIAAGVNGQTTADMLARFDADVVARRPRIVHIMGGTNDLWHGHPGEDAQGTAANLAAMIDRARSAGIVPVVALPPPIAPAAVRLLAHPDLLEALPAAIRRLCRAATVRCVDYGLSLADGQGALRPEVTTDGIHLNAAGYRAMRRQAEAALA